MFFTVGLLVVIAILIIVHLFLFVRSDKNDSKFDESFINNVQEHFNEHEKEIVMENIVVEETPSSEKIFRDFQILQSHFHVIDEMTKMAHNRITDVELAMKKLEIVAPSVEETQREYFVDDINGKVRELDLFKEEVRLELARIKALMSSLHQKISIDANESEKGKNVELLKV